MTIKDKNGTELRFGDTVRHERESGPAGSYYRFCYAGRSRQEQAVYGMFVDGRGRKVSLSAGHDGTIDYISRVTAAADYAELRTGSWVPDHADGKPVTVCSCCGSLMPTTTEMDTISMKDNRYCSFCGAKMEVG